MNTRQEELERLLAERRVEIPTFTWPVLASRPRIYTHCKRHRNILLISTLSKTTLSQILAQGVQPHQARTPSIPLVLAGLGAPLRVITSILEWSMIVPVTRGVTITGTGGECAVGSFNGRPRERLEGGMSWRAPPSSFLGHHLPAESRKVM